MVGWVRYVAKAVIAGATAFGGAFALAIADESAGGSGLVANEIAVIAVATVVAVAGVFYVSNGAKPSAA